MLIADIDLHTSAILTDELGAAAFGQKDSQLGWLTLRTKNGAEGRAPIRMDFANLARSAADAFLKGKDARATAAHWSKLHTAAASDRYETLPATVIAAIDLALWGLRAQYNGVPLYREIGGENVGTPAMRTLPHATNDYSSSEIASRLTSDIQQHGLFMLAAPTTQDEATDIEILGAAWKNLSTAAPSGILGACFSGSLSPKAAIRHVSALERVVDLAFVEAPVSDWDAEGLRKVSDGVRAAVCNSPALGTRTEFYPLLQKRALDIIQINPHLSGITGTLELADAAYAFELPVMIAPTVQGLGAHIAGALPYTMCVRLPETADTLCQGMTISDGMITAGEVTGAGWITNDGGAS